MIGGGPPRAGVQPVHRRSSPRSARGSTPTGIALLLPRRHARATATRVVERFKDGDGPVFLISLKAGGFGLNLTEADYCLPARPVVEPGHRGAGRRPHPPHRPDPQRHGLPAGRRRTPSRRRSSRSRSARRSCSPASWTTATRSARRSPPTTSAGCWSDYSVSRSPRNAASRPGGSAAVCELDPAVEPAGGRRRGRRAPVAPPPAHPPRGGACAPSLPTPHPALPRSRVARRPDLRATAPRTGRPRLTVPGRSVPAVLTMAVATAPLTLARVFTAWRAEPAVLAAAAALGGGYGWGLRRRASAGGEPWPSGRTTAFLAGVATILVIGCSFLGVYDDAFFWVRAVQNTVLLMVTPMLLALGAPIRLAADTLPPRDPRAAEDGAAQPRRTGVDVSAGHHRRAGRAAARALPLAAVRADPAQRRRVRASRARS